MYRPAMDQRWLEPELQRGLGEVAAPEELWDRIQSPQAAQTNRARPRLVLAMAAVVILAALALSRVRSEDETLAVQALASSSPQLAFRCQNSVQLRAWVRANTGLDVPLRSKPAPSIQLIGARTVEGHAEIAYRAGNNDAVLVVSKAASGVAKIPHSRSNGRISSWVTAGQRFTIACNDPADFQLACRLCHLD